MRNIILFCFCLFSFAVSKRNVLHQQFCWKQITYNFDGVKYLNNTDVEQKSDAVNFEGALQDKEKFFIQYNNVPIGLEVYKKRVFVTVPRRRHGIPSSLNYILPGDGPSPALRPYPNTASAKTIISVYRPRVDACGRLWAVDTGMYEVPGERVQAQAPAIIVFDLETDAILLRYELKPSDLVDERTPAGLTSITVDVHKAHCDDAYAYINDLATEGLIVFSMKKRDSWRINHPSFVHDDAAMNFTIKGNLINWKDGLFSVALSEPVHGKRTAYYHPFISTQEFTVDTEFLKTNNFEGKSQLVGSRGALSQSGSHDYHPRTKTMFYANVAQNAIQCWNTGRPLTPSNVAIAARNDEKLVYISDLKVIGDHVWVLVNKIPIFIYSTYDLTKDNFYIHKLKIQDIIRGTPCENKKYS